MARTEADVRMNPIAGDVVCAWHGDAHFKVLFVGWDGQGDVVKFDDVYPEPHKPIEALSVSCQIPLKKWRTTMKNAEVITVAQEPANG